MPKLSTNHLKLRAAIKGPKKTYTIDGHPGLYLRVYGNGAASWAVRYRVGGVLKLKVLSNDAANASFDQIVTVKDEIRLATRTHGIDLIEQRQAEAKARADCERASKLTLDVVVEEWIQKPRARGLRPRTIKLYRSTFAAYVLPKFGSRPINEITKVEIRKHFDDERDRLLKHSTRTTRAEVIGKAFSYLDAVFEYAVDEGYVIASPMRGLPRPVPKEPDRKSSRPLRPVELRTVWLEAEKHASLSFARMIKLLLVLGRRRSEVAGAHKDEFHLDGEMPHWLIPPREGNKSAVPSLVPLARLSISIIKAAWADSGSSEFLFPQSRGVEDKPIQPDALTHAWCDLREACGLPDNINLHDARGLFTDALEQMGVPDNIVSHCLHHTSDMKGTTAKRVYSSNQFHPEKRRALRLWELRLKNIVSGKGLHSLRWAA